MPMQGSLSDGIVAMPCCVLLRRVWDTNSGACKQVLRGHMGPIWCMAYDAGSNRIASGSGGGHMDIWRGRRPGETVQAQPLVCLHACTARGQRQLPPPFTTP